MSTRIALRPFGRGRHTRSLSLSSAEGTRRSGLEMVSSSFPDLLHRSVGRPLPLPDTSPAPATRSAHDTRVFACTTHACVNSDAHEHPFGVCPVSRCYSRIAPHHDNNLAHPLLFAAQISADDEDDADKADHACREAGRRRLTARKISAGLDLRHARGALPSVLLEQLVLWHDSTQQLHTCRSIWRVHRKPGNSARTAACPVVNLR